MPNSPGTRQTSNEAAGRLYRLAQTGMLMSYYYAVRNHKRRPTLHLDEDGMIVPTDKALAEVKRDNPRIYQLAMAGRR
jgi:hypothetical protein